MSKNASLAQLNSNGMVLASCLTILSVLLALGIGIRVIKLVPNVRQFLLAEEVRYQRGFARAGIGRDQSHRQSEIAAQSFD